MPINYLLIESLQKFHHYYGDDFKVECPTGSGQFMTLNADRERSFQSSDPALAARRRGAATFHARLHRTSILTQKRDHDRYWFHEYFHGDTGAGLGASHQTGWTGLVAKLIQQQGEHGTISKRDPFTDL